MKHYITIDKKYQNESTASERPVMNYWVRGTCVCVCVWGGGGGGVAGGGRRLKLALRDPNPRPQLP